MTVFPSTGEGWRVNLANLRCKDCPDSDLGEIYPDLCRRTVTKKAPLLRRGLLIPLPATITAGRAVVTARWTVIPARGAVINRRWAVIDRLLHVDRCWLVINRRWAVVNRLWLSVNRLLYIDWAVAVDEG
jgi:hypothetical protein